MEKTTMAADVSARTREEIRIDDLEQGARIFEDAVNSGDVEAVGGLYEPDAIFLPEPGKAARGRDEIREAFAGFAALKPKFELRRKALLVIGDIAAEWGEWTLEGHDAEGRPVNLQGRFMAVLRRQPDGRWLLAIDDPFCFA